MNPERKRELKAQYKEMKTEAGVYQIRNTVNQKVLVMSTRNLKTINGKLFMLKNGSFFNDKIKKDLELHGPDAFVIEVLEILPKPEEGYFDERDALKKLEMKWLDRLQPFGSQGYN